MFVICWLLLVGCCLLFAVCRVLLGLLFDGCCLLFAVWRLLFVCPLFVVCYSLLLVVVRCAIVVSG